jgi:hypothetical protein
MAGLINKNITNYISIAVQDKYVIFAESEDGSNFID